MTQERTIRSLTEIAEQYSRFRSDWELANMIPFVKMLADRQAALRDASRKTAGEATGTVDSARQTSAARRQAKIAELCELSRRAFAGLSQRVGKDEPTMGK